MAEASLSGIEFTIKGNADSASNSIKKLTDRLEQLRGALKSASSVSKIGDAFKVMANDITSSLKPLKKFGDAIKRIIFYRAIRFAIKQVSEAFQVGLKNAYQFSKLVGYELADTMDNIATKSLTMKNQMGAAFGGLIMAIEPIVLRLIALVTRAANAIAQLMAILGGKSTYLKAVDTMTEWGEAVGGAGAAAKEALKYLAPFDELNVLPDDKNGGGGGGSSVPDYSAMFEETAVSQALQDFITDFKISVSDVLFDWSDLTGEQIAEKVLAGLFALTGAGVGFILGGVPGAIVGSIIGLTLGLVADTLVFDHDGVLSREEIGHSLQYVLNALAGGVVGFVVGGPGGAFIGASIGLGISLVADIFDLKAEGENKNSNWLNQLTVALSTLAGGVIGFVVGGPAGALIGATIGFGVSAVVESVRFSASEGGTFSGGLDYFVTEVLGLPTDEEWKQYGRNIWNWIVEGFQDFVGELKNIFVQPIIDAFEDFSLKDLLFGGDDSGGDSSAGNWFSNIFGGGIQTEVEVTGVKDSIPEDGKKLSGFQSVIQAAQDNIDSAKKKITDFTAELKNRIVNRSSFDLTIHDMISEFGSRKINKSKYDTTIHDMTSEFGGRKLNKDKYDTTIHGMTSEFSGRKTNSSTFDMTIHGMGAEFKYRKITDTFSTIFGSTANFIKAVTGWRSDPSLSAEAYFDSYSNGLTGWKKPTIGVDAYVDHFDSRGYPVSYGATGGVFGAKGLLSSIPQYASGGTPRHGSLLIAGEAGAELVGHIGGRTEVLNRSQLAATMYAAVHSAMSGIAFNVSAPSMATGTADDGANEDMLYRAFLRALNDADNEVEVNLDGNVIYKNVVKHNRQERVRTGMNPMLAY